MTTELPENKGGGAVPIMDLKKVKVAVCAALQMKERKCNLENLKGEYRRFRIYFPMYAVLEYCDFTFQELTRTTKVRNPGTDLVCICVDYPGTSGLVVIVLMTRVIGKAEGPGKTSQGTAALWRQTKRNTALTVPSATEWGPKRGL